MKIDVQIISMQGAMDEISGLREIPDGTTANELVGLLGLPPGETYALMVNHMPVAAADRDTRVLRTHDQVTIFPPIRGG